MYHKRLSVIVVHLQKKLRSLSPLIVARIDTICQSFFSTMEIEQIGSNTLEQMGTQWEQLHGTNETLFVHVNCPTGMLYFIWNESGAILKYNVFICLHYGTDIWPLVSGSLQTKFNTVWIIMKWITKFTLFRKVTKFGQPNTDVVREFCRKGIAGLNVISHEPHRTIGCDCNLGTYFDQLLFPVDDYSFKRGIMTNI